ncbi:MAG: signal peptidase II [Planctomycetota bacterium]
MAESPTVVPPPSAPVFTGWQRWFWPALISVLVVDLVSKSVVFAMSADALPFGFQRHYNTGVAWSMFAGHPGYVTALTAVLIPVLALVWWKAYRHNSRIENLAFGCILGGALGNAYDRALALFGCWPGVRDFIAVKLNPIGINYEWPTFNVADSGITVGFVMLLVGSFFVRPPAAQPTAV